MEGSLLRCRIKKENEILKGSSNPGKKHGSLLTTN
jgi:hypothetical protein